MESKTNTGDYDWTCERLLFRWELVRRTEKYKAFCDENKIYFENGLMSESVFIEGAIEVRRKYGLDLVYHHTVNFKCSNIIDSLVFSDPFAIRYIYPEKKEENGVIVNDPIWGDGKIRMEINSTLSH